MKARSLGRGVGSLMISSQRWSSTTESSRSLLSTASRSAGLSFGSSLMISDALTSRSTNCLRRIVSASNVPRVLFQGHTRFVGPILQSNLSLCSARCLLFADFHFRAGQIPGVILDHVTGNSNSGDHQQAVRGRKHVSQSGREKMGDRALQNFLRKGRFSPKCGVGVVAMRSYHCRDLHEAESSRSGSNSSRPMARCLRPAFGGLTRSWPL